MLQVDSLEHAYGDNRVLYGVYLSCKPGEVVGVVGRNGCGKTTMLRAIFGVLSATHMLSDYMKVLISYIQTINVVA